MTCLRLVICKINMTESTTFATGRIERQLERVLGNASSGGTKSRLMLALDGADRPEADSPSRLTTYPIADIRSSPSAGSRTCAVADLRLTTTFALDGAGA